MSVDVEGPSYHLNVAPPAAPSTPPVDVEGPAYRLNVAYSAQIGRLNQSGSVVPIASGVVLRTGRSIFTYPRSFGAYGTYEASAATTGIPDEFKSEAQANAHEGDLVVTDPYMVLDTVEVRGDLDFSQVPFMAVKPRRLWVRGRSDYTTSTGLVRFMNAVDDPRRQPITLQDSTVEPLVTSQWTRGVEGWAFDLERVQIVHCQDGIMARSHPVTLKCDASTHGSLIDWLTYFLVDTQRASSGQVHADDLQLNGADGFTDVGSTYFARWSPRGAFQPTLLQDPRLPPINNPVASTDHPESTCVQVNYGSTTGTKSQRLLFDRTRMFGGYFAFNYGDSGNDGVSLGELRDVLFDSFDKRTDVNGNPVATVNGRTAQPLTLTRCGYVGDFAGKPVVPRLSA